MILCGSILYSEQSSESHFLKILLSVENQLKMLSYISVSWMIISFDNNWQPHWYQTIIETKFQTDKITCSYYYICIESEPSVQYIPRNMHTIFALLCFVVVIHWLIFPYPSGLLHWHCGNLTIAPVPAKQPWWIWINTSCEFIMNDCITTTKQSTTKPCAYLLGYTVFWTSVLTKHPLSPFLLKWSCPYPVECRKSWRFHGELTHMINTFHDFIHKHIFPITPCCISGCVMLQILTSGWGFLEQNYGSSAQRGFKPCPRYNLGVLWWDKISAFIFTWWGYSYNSQIEIMWVIDCIICSDLNWPCDHGCIISV